METLNLTGIMNETTNTVENKQFEIYDPKLKESFEWFGCFADSFEFECIDKDHPEFICNISIRLVLGGSFIVSYKCKPEQINDWIDGKIDTPEVVSYDIKKDTLYKIHKGIRRIANSYLN